MIYATEEQIQACGQKYNTLEDAKKKFVRASLLCPLYPRSHGNARRTNQVRSVLKHVFSGTRERTLAKGHGQSARERSDSCVTLIVNVPLRAQYPRANARQ